MEFACRALTVGSLHNNVRCVEAQAPIQVVRVVGLDRCLDDVLRSSCSSKMPGKF